MQLLKLSFLWIIGGLHQLFRSILNSDLDVILVCTYNKFGGFVKMRR